MMNKPNLFAIISEMAATASNDGIPSIGYSPSVSNEKSHTNLHTHHHSILQPTTSYPPIPTISSSRKKSSQTNMRLSRHELTSLPVAADPSSSVLALGSNSSGYKIHKKNSKHNTIAIRSKNFSDRASDRSSECATTSSELFAHNNEVYFFFYFGGYFYVHFFICF